MAPETVPPVPPETVPAPPDVERFLLAGDRPLRVLITRPEDQADESAALVLSRLTDSPVRDLIVAGPDMNADELAHLMVALQGAQGRVGPFDWWVLPRAQDRVVTVLQRHGAIDIDERAETWQKEGGAAATTTATATATKAAAAVTTAATAATVATDTVRSAGQAEVALPVIEEELRVGKRVVQRGGVRVYTNVSERPVEEQIRLREERVSVERHPVDRPVTDADLRSFEQGSFEVTERAEEAVVSKQARIVEEVVVSKQVAERTEAIRDTLRRTDVEVESIAPGAPTFDAYSTDFQHHFTTSFGSAGGTFEQYTPAYRYGLGLASDPRYHGVDWSTLEADARRSWEEREPGTWERFKDAIKYAWQKVQNKLQS